MNKQKISKNFKKSKDKERENYKICWATRMESNIFLDILFILVLFIISIHSKNLEDLIANVLKSTKHLFKKKIQAKFFMPTCVLNF